VDALRLCVRQWLLGLPAAPARRPVRPGLFTAGVYARPAFVYRPQYVVYDDALYGSLFVRPGGGYYFGDYYDVRYERLGYRSWFSVRVGFAYDPLFSYYRASNGSAWALQINNVYVSRQRYPTCDRRARSCSKNVVVNNITNNTTINNTTVNNVKNVTMVAPITNINKSGVVNLTKITPAQQQQAAQGAREISASFGAARQVGDPGLPPAVAGRGEPTAQPRTVKFDLPKPPAAAATALVNAPPPLPTHSDTPTLRGRGTPPPTITTANHAGSAAADQPADRLERHSAAVAEPAPARTRRPRRTRRRARATRCRPRLRRR